MILRTTFALAVLAGVILGCNAAPMDSPTPTLSVAPATQSTEPSTLTPEPTDVVPPSAALGLGEDAQKYQAFSDHLAVSTREIAAAMESVPENPTQADITAINDLLVTEMDWLADNPPAPCYLDVHMAYFEGVSLASLGISLGMSGDIESLETMLGRGNDALLRAAELLQADPARCLP